MRAGVGNAWEILVRRRFEGGRISGCFGIPDADVADIGKADDERLSSCSVAAGGLHRGLQADGAVEGAEACI